MKKIKRIEVSQTETMAIVASFIPVPLIAIMVAVIIFLHGNIFALDYANRKTVLVMVAALLCCIPHEALHGIGWIVFGKKWSDMHFGLKLPLAAYIRFDGEMKMACFRVGLILPFIITSLVPMIAGMFLGNFYCFIFGAIQATGCGSDILSAIRSLKFDANDTVIDDMGVTGFVVLKKISEA